MADNVTVAEWIVEREEVKIKDVSELRRHCECHAACDGAVTYVKTSLDRRPQAASCSKGSQQQGEGRIRMGKYRVTHQIGPNLPLISK